MSTFQDEKQFRKELKRGLGIRTRNVELFRQALRHTSVLEGNDPRYSNERLEFLGDAILDAVISEHLYQQFPEAEEGFLTRMRSKLVSRERLSCLAEDLGILRLLEHRIEPDKLKSTGIGGDAVEALVGAFYLDKGFSKTRSWVLRTFMAPFDIEKLKNIETDPKSRLIEWAQKEGREVSFQPLPSEEELHVALLSVDGKEVSQGEGRSKKKAEQEAAKRYFDTEGRREGSQELS